LILIPDPENPRRSRQLMTLWSTKETEAIRVSGHWWKPGKRMNTDEHGGQVIPGMVCAWWYDGTKMFEPLAMRECRMAVISDKHPLWPREGLGDGAGAIVPLEDEDSSFGMNSGNDSMWMNLRSDKEAQKIGAPSSFEAEFSPWWGPPSDLTYKNNVLSMGMGYDILRLQAMRAKITIDDDEFEGTAYFQKVTVQAPTIPWFWGMLHFEDGSYLDWFVPHLTPLSSSKDDEPWRLRDMVRKPLRTAGVFHDRKGEKTEEFENCRVSLSKSAIGLLDDQGNLLPEFDIKLWNERTNISLRVLACSRARWTFDQPTRGGTVSHLTYNEYPLEVDEIIIADKLGTRSIDDFGWIHGNAEHSWGFLH